MSPQTIPAIAFLQTHKAGSPEKKRKRRKVRRRINLRSSMPSTYGEAWVTIHTKPWPKRNLLATNSREKRATTLLGGKIGSTTILRGDGRIKNDAREGLADLMRA